MAPAAAEGEKGSPIVVGLLVVGNTIILVRHLEWGGLWGVLGGGSPELGWELRTWDSGRLLAVSLKAQHPGLNPSTTFPQLCDCEGEPDFRVPPLPPL